MLFPAGKLAGELGAIGVPGAPLLLMGTTDMVKVGGAGAADAVDTSALDSGPGALGTGTLLAGTDTADVATGVGVASTGAAGELDSAGGVEAGTGFWTWPSAGCVLVKVLQNWLF